MTDREIMQQALEFVEFVWRDVSLNDYAEEKRRHIEKILEDALAKPEQEPVAWLNEENGLLILKTTHPQNYAPLYRSPPQRKPLTVDQIYEMYSEPSSDAEMVEFARAIERAHGIVS